MMEFGLAVALGYVIGSFPSGLVFGRAFWNIDLREHGSKNIGATNAYRILGRGPAALIFFSDLLKGALCVWLGGHLAGTSTAMIFGGIMAIVGHSWSLFMGFHGGKGVATGLGVILMLMPQVTMIVFGVWCALVYITKYVSLGSIAAAALVPACTYVFGYPAEYLLFALAAACFVIYRHKTNIGRLLSGTESKIKAGHRGKK